MLKERRKKKEVQMMKSELLENRNLWTKEASREGEEEGKAVAKVVNRV